MTLMKINEGNKILAEFIGEITTDGHPQGSKCWAIHFPQSFCDQLRNKYSVFSSKNFIFENNLYFHSSWDWIIPVCKKWDCLKLKQFNDTDLEIYELLSDDLDNKATLYEIEPVFIQLVKNIKWLNSLKYLFYIEK